MASQVVMQKTLMREKSLQTICSKLLLQMNCKRGGELWGINIPLKKLMVIGIDESKDVTSIVVSTNDTFSQYYSGVIMRKNKDKKVQDVVKKGLETFKMQHNGDIPENVIIFKNGMACQDENLKTMFREDEFKGD